jgi:cell wall-associated NlpC family hydrolase
MTHATLRARLGVTAATLLTGLGIFLIPAMTPAANAASADITQMAMSATPSSATTHTRTSAHARLMQRHDRLVHDVLSEARRQKGKPYSYGAAGPHAFDCSGLVMYVFEHSVHKVLPHNAAAQFHSLHHIKRRELRKGDLVFTDNGSITHVGIFAGHHHWWVAPHTGARVHKQRIYHAHFVYARVLRIH